MNNIHIKWRILLALNALHEKGKTPSTIISDSFINYLIHTRRLVRLKLSNARYLEPCPGFTEFYEKNLQTDFRNAEQFLIQAGLEHDARRSYTLDDIHTLQFIAINKTQLQQSLTTLRTFSSQIFPHGGSKYLETHQSLLNAVYHLLEIKQFPAEDPKVLQWRFVVDCPEARIVVLCENLNFLKTPRIARENHIELWYVGGNNINNIDYIPKHKLILPLYYSCDWDYDGLKIYERLCARFAQKQKSITLLHPFPIRCKSVNSPEHNSCWKHNKPFSDLNISLFQPEDIALIQKLINCDEWVEEETLDLIEMTRKYFSKNLF